METVHTFRKVELNSQTQWPRYEAVVFLDIQSVATVFTSFQIMLKRISRSSHTTLIVFLVLVALVLYIFRYEPPVIAAPGFNLFWVTRPSILKSPIQSINRLLDRRPCKYILLGWAGAENLYYQASCKGYSGQYNITTIVNYNHQNKTLTDVKNIPINLDGIGVQKADILLKVRAYGIKPVEFEPYTRQIYIRGDGIASPDNKWMAIVSGWDFGPEDILIVSKV